MKLDLITRIPSDAPEYEADRERCLPVLARELDVVRTAIGREYLSYREGASHWSTWNFDDLNCASALQDLTKLLDQFGHEEWRLLAVTATMAIKKY